MNQTLTPEATPKQISFLNRLLTEADELLTRRYGITMVAWPEAADAVNRMRAVADRMTRREASAAIDQAMDNNRKLREELASLAAEHGIPEAEPQYVTETGMYRVDGRIYKVLPSRTSERHYAKELVGESEGGYRFVYAPGAMRFIRAEHRMTDEQAREFGRTTGICCVCARLLTDPKSIADGIGPVCSGKR